MKQMRNIYCFYEEMSKLSVMLQKLNDDFISLTNTRKAFLGLKLHLKLLSHYCTLDDIKCQVEDSLNRNCSGRKGGTNKKTNYETALPTMHVCCNSLFFSFFQCFSNLALKQIVGCHADLSFLLGGEYVCASGTIINAQLLTKGC